MNPVFKTVRVRTGFDACANIFFSWNEVEIENWSDAKIQDMTKHIVLGCHTKFQLKKIK